MPKHRRGYCCFCQKVRALTRHHVFPKRFFGNKNPYILMICRDCHDKLELRIPYKRQPRKFYIDVITQFLKDMIAEIKEFRLPQINGEDLNTFYPDFYEDFSSSDGSQEKEITYR